MSETSTASAAYWDRAPQATKTTAEIDVDFVETAVDEKLARDLWDELAGEVTAILRKKQQDYGPHNILITEHVGLAVRLTDKAARLYNMARSENNPHFESIRDTYLDVAGYGIIGMMLSDGNFPPEENE